MIRYSLVCAQEHAFDSWFRDSAAFDDLSQQGHVTCPQCGSADVRKAMMAPSIRRIAARKGVGEPMPPVPTAPQSIVANEIVVEASSAIEDEKSRQMRAVIRDMHAKIKAHAENVGAAFPEQARKIHDGAEPPRSIYGTATSDEVRSLVEDGVSIMPLPPLPDDRN